MKKQKNRTLEFKYIRNGVECVTRYFGFAKARRDEGTEIVVVKLKNA